MALINAAIDMIGDHGSLDVPVKEIARQAGMSSALAFHYFGGKDEILTETMRHLLREFTASVVSAMHEARSPQERIDAVILASFSDEQFERKTIAAWLVFYLHAYSSPSAARLLSIYRRRLSSNLASALSAMTGRENSRQIALGLGALIDGIYIRQGLDPEGPDPESARLMCRNFIASALAHEPNEHKDRKLN